MTAICPSGGTSSARPGYAATVAMTIPAIAALLNNIPTVWAVPFAALLGLVTYELATFCTIDPPTLPTLTASDFLDLLTLVDPLAHGRAQQKLQDFVSYYAWFQYCQCDAAATPDPHAPQAQPTGMPAINPPGTGGTYPTGQPCASYTFSGDESSSTILLPLTPIGAITYAVMTVSVPLTSLPSPHTWSIQTSFWNASGPLTGNCALILSSSGTTSRPSCVVPTGATQFEVTTQTTFGPSTAFNWTAQLDLYCGTTPTGGGGSIPLPCVADPITTLTLQQILQLVTLIQRNTAPFAYVPGATHAGLTGAGTLTIPACIGIELTLTTVPGYVGEEAGAPTEYFAAGWYSWGDTSGYTAREWISHSPQLSFPAGAAKYTRLGYSLNPGVVATLRELYAET